MAQKLVLRPKQSPWLAWAHLPMGSGALPYSNCLQCSKEWLSLPSGTQGRGSPCPLWLLHGGTASLPSLDHPEEMSALGTQGTTSKRCRPFQLCFSYGDPGLLLFLQARDRAADTFTSPREGAAESPAGSSPLSGLESNAKPQPDLWWCVVFLLFDSKHPGTCFLTSLCIHAENKQSLYKTPNISP